VQNSGRAPALQLQSPEFKLQSQQNKTKTKRLKEIHEIAAK
jgi:hypothetical protein